MSDGVEESTIEKLQKENADLKQQIEKQRSDLILFARIIRWKLDGLWSNVLQFDWYARHGDFTDPEIREWMTQNLPAQEVTDELPKNGAHNGAVSL